MKNNSITSIKRLFRQPNVTFEAPPYQRAYSWEKEQTKRFLEDLNECGGLFYLGHFLFQAAAADGKTSKLLVIDGQQRLMTCVIFLSAVKQELARRKDAGETVDYAIESLGCYVRDRVEKTQKFRAGSADNDYFVSEIIDWHNTAAATRSQRNIQDAKKRFASAIKKKETEAIVQWAGWLQDAVITTHTVSNTMNGAQIFIYQNQRGKKPSNLEIIKSHLMPRVSRSAGKDKINEDITCIETCFKELYHQAVKMKHHENDALNYYWRGVSGRGYDSGEVIQGVTEHIQAARKAGNGAVSRWIHDFTSGLLAAFKTVEKLEESTDWAVSNINYLNHPALSYPFLMKAYRIGADKAGIARLAALLENLTFRRLLRGGRAELEKRLNWPLNYLDTGIASCIDEIKEEFLDTDWWRDWSDDEMRQHLSHHRISPKIVKYLLWRYELHLARDDYPLPENISSPDFMRSVSIEHIAPQTSHQPVAHGYGVYHDRENPGNGIVSGGWINRVGNLTLISQKHNRAIGNKPFAQKYASYGKEHFLNQQKEIPSFVTGAKNPVWDAEAIRKRGEKIVSAALEIWDIQKI